MKRYIRSGIQSNDADYTFNFEILFCNVPEAIMSSISTDNGKYYITVKDNDGNRIKQEITEEFYTYVMSILNLVERMGFEELDTDKSDRSDSLYFVFCYKTEASVLKVRFIFTMRVSEHDLTMWSSDKTQKDARTRQKNYQTQMLEEYEDYSSEIDDGSIPQIIPSYIKYDDKYFDRTDVVLDLVQRRLNFLKSKFKAKV